MYQIATIFILLLSTGLFSQTSSFTQYEPSAEYPFGRLNPDAPAAVADFAPMIGECDCLSERITPDGTWTEPEEMIWRFKYIMNGRAVQDETLKADGKHSGSIRLYNPDSAQWYVHWYSDSPVTPRMPTWTGGKKDNKVILYRSQKAPNGSEGYYRLTFYNISDNGYSWVGEWTNLDETFTFPSWKIQCERRK